MFGLADFVGGLLVSNPPKPDPTPDPFRASRELVAQMEARRDAARERMRLERPKVYKLATKCPHCTSHDYQTHRGRVQCAFCRIPASRQPERHDPRGYRTPLSDLDREYNRARWMARHPY